MRTSTVAAIVLLSACGSDADSPSVTACSDCVVLDSIETLDFAAEDFFPSPFGKVAADRSWSTWAFVDRQIDTQVSVFGSDGVTIVGREGDGPGEFRQVDDVWFDASGRLAVLHQGAGRIRRYDGDFQVVSEQSVPFRIRARSSLANEMLVVADYGRDGAEVGRLDSDGVLTPLELPPMSGDASLILVASDLDDTGWVIEPNSFRIWRVPTGDAPQLLTDQAPDWFYESYRPDVTERMNEIGADTDGTTALGLAYDPAADLIWVSFGVPSPDFTLASLERILTGEPELRVEMLDHVVVAISPSDGSIQGMGRFDYLDLNPGDQFLYDLTAPEKLVVRFPRLAGDS